jgi:hypothetical protein
VNHARLLTLLKQEDSPEWFVKLIEGEFHKLEYGAPFKEGAQRIWDELRKGFDAQDSEKNMGALPACLPHGSAGMRKNPGPEDTGYTCSLCEGAT